MLRSISSSQANTGSGGFFVGGSGRLLLPPSGRHRYNLSSRSSPRLGLWRGKEKRESAVWVQHPRMGGGVMTATMKLWVSGALGEMSRPFCFPFARPLSAAPQNLSRHKHQERERGREINEDVPDVALLSRGRGGGVKKEKKSVLLWAAVSHSACRLCKNREASL